MTTSDSGRTALITKKHILLLVSLIFTWWIASLVPHYKPMIRAKLQDARKKIPNIKINWPKPDAVPQYDRRKLALLVEKRPLPHMVSQMLHMMTVVPPDWRFLFIGSEESVISVNRSYAIKYQQVIGKLDLMTLPEPWSIDSKEMVYRAMTDVRFYDEFLPEVEWILKYESDSILCSMSSVSLNDWLQWDWTGAQRQQNDRFAGNGGLSLRRVSAIRRVLSIADRANNSQPEDEWFGRSMWTLRDAKVAAGVENALAVEDVYHEKAMGYHVRDGGSQLADAVWKNPDQRKRIFEYCPELSIIMDMKLERERCDGDDRQGNLPAPEPKPKPKPKPKPAPQESKPDEKEKDEKPEGKEGDGEGEKGDDKGDEKEDEKKKDDKEDDKKGDDDTEDGAGGEDDD